MAIPVTVETGTRWTFATAVAWPGWCRRGRTEAEALQALLDAVPRYRRAMGRAARGFTVPTSLRAFRVVERLPGDSTTDFGAPGQIPTADRAPLQATELKRLVAMLRGAWNAFDEAASAAGRRTLRTGPRGGGRDTAKMRAHVLDADLSYFAQLGVRPEPGSGSYAQMADRVRPAFVDALGASARGELPARGPRGGERWPARYTIRRSAWHALDHAWEIEDRLS